MIFFLLTLISYKYLSDYGISSVYKSKNESKYFGWGRKGIVIKTNTDLIEIPHIGQVFGIAEDENNDIWAASKEIESKNRRIGKPKGLIMTKERLEYLNDDKHRNFKIEIIDLYSTDNKPRGTRVEITLAFVLG